MYSINDLNAINDELMPLKALAIREFKSIQGLSGQVYTPHIDAYNTVSLVKAKILFELKRKGDLPFSDVEVISAKLMALYQKAKPNQVVDYNGESYECRYSPLKLSKSGKTVRKWAKYWLKILPDGEKDRDWEIQVHEIWPENFIIRSIDY